MGRKRRDLVVGKKFGRLTVLKEAGRKYKKIAWLCKCDCGNYSRVPTSNLISGGTRSCGCLSKEVLTKHGQRDTRLYHIWISMWQRCSNPNHCAYQNYGGRGIKIYDGWKDFRNFYKWAIKTGYSDDLTIERAKNHEGYNPENCKWATKLEQTRNRRNTIRVTINDERITLAELSERTGIKLDTLRGRIYRGWPDEKLAEPLVSGRKEKSHA